MTPRPSLNASQFVRGRQWVLAGAAALLVLIALVVLVVVRAVGPAAAGSRRMVVFTIPNGASAAAIGDRLAARHLIVSALAFRLWSEHLHVAAGFRPGEYRVSPGWTLTKMVRVLSEGHILMARVSIPEGFTLTEIAARLEAQHVVSAGAFRRALAEGLPGLAVPPAARGSLEGFLFPDTYLIPRGTSARQVVLLMWRDFLSRTAQLRPDLRRHHLSLWSWVTLASIVQAEDANPVEAPRVAAVFLNRLKIHMPLQSDATVRYALGDPGGALTLQDLAIASPYNTFHVRGLPVGPIDSPGMVALRAVLEPASVRYLYFVTTPTGSVLFADTYAQHLRNVKQVDALRRQKHA